MSPRRIGVFRLEDPRRNAPSRPPDCGVSRAAAEARSYSAMGGEAATPTSGAEGQYETPRNRSVAEVSRSRRDWASGCVSPTGARRDRPSGRPDEWREENAARGPESTRSHTGGRGCGLARMQPAGAPQARSVGGWWDRGTLAFRGHAILQRVAAVADRGRRASGHGDGDGHVPHTPTPPGGFRRGGEEGGELKRSYVSLIPVYGARHIGVEARSRIYSSASC